jgi:hypothetical protein
VFTLFDAAYVGRAMLARRDEGRWQAVKISIGDVRDEVKFP